MSCAVQNCPVPKCLEDRVPRSQRDRQELQFSTLLTFDWENFPKLEGDIAKSWEMAEDGLSYTFKLHENVKFHDGTPLTSADVKASYERIAFPPEGVLSQRKA